MPLVTTQATILKTYEYSETSKILRLLTRDHGLCSVIAKGARRPKSRFGGLLEPFTDGVATYYAKDGRDLHTLSSFELRRERQNLGRELMRYAGAGLLTEIVLRFASSAEDQRLFDRLRFGLDRLLEERSDVETAILEEMWKLVTCLGFAPNLASCSICDRIAPPQEAVRFDLAGGAIVCERCLPRVSRPTLHRLKPDARADLNALVNGSGIGHPRFVTAAEQRVLLRDFIAYHLADHRPLNSFRFLADRLG